MNLTISPVGIGLVIIIISNCLLSFGKSDLMKRVYIILSASLAILGILGIIGTRLRFVSSLTKSAARRDFDSEFVSWAIMKFDFFAVISILVTGLSIILLLYLLLINKEKKSSFFWDGLHVFIIILMVIIFFAGAWYSLGTINKLFDIGYYIGVLSISEIFALYIPLIAKRIV